ncbi:MAG TPA: hypothetical protein PLJ59_00165 [Solirubrobacterales bacterium]|nr:hypothetical protein [Solirubrobacterales bacterium]
MNIQSFVRRILPALIILVGGFTATGTQAIAAGKARPVKVSIAAISTANQQQLIKQKKLAVKVKSTGKVSARLTATSGGKGGYFKATTVKFSRKGSKTVKLALTSSGKTALSKCGAKTVTTVASYRRKVGGKSKQAKSSKKKTLAKWAANENCIEYASVELGDDPEHCDFMDTTVCLQPWPNDYYMKDDASTPTGKRLDIAPGATPENTDGTHIAVTDINRGDGFSPGNLIVLKVPGLDTPAAFANNDFVTLSDLHAYDDPAQRVMLIDAATGERQPIWTELDANPTSTDPGEDDPGGINTNPSNTTPVNLIVRPARNLEWGHRYIVAFRDLRDASDNPIQSPLGFRVYRDELPTRQAIVEARRDHMNSVIGDLVDKAGVERSSLYMAWDFTVASQGSVTSRALQVRDDAFARLGDNNLGNRVIEGSSPDVQIEYVCDRYENPDSENPVSDGCNGGPNPPSGTDRRPDVPGSDIIRVIDGEILDVPCYLNQNGCPSGATFEFKPDGSIDFNENFTTDVPFRCFIPSSVQPAGQNTAVTPGQAGIYGHGLLGDRYQVTSAGPVNVATQGGSVWCGADWQGFSTGDLLSVFQALGDMSNFPKMADRMLQGFLNFMMIQRAMIHPDGFADLPAFQLDPDGPGGEDPVSVIDVSAGANTRGVYYGISQGGIMGGALMALTPDSDYGVLGVPGMNYSNLLRRSVDSDTYFKTPGVGLYTHYPDEHERPLMLSLIQLLWDRGEANGYANNMTNDPLPDTPAHGVLLEVAYGDHQVTNYSAEVEARTIGAGIYSPALNAGRHWDVDPFLGMDQISSFPHQGSMLVYYDSGPVSFTGNRGQGIGKPPLEEMPPRSEWGYGRDPHEDPRRSPDGIDQATTFLQNGTIASCEVITPLPSGDAHCYANGYTGPTP